MALQTGTEVVVDACEFHGVDPDIGAFMAPTLLRATDKDARAVHATEAFGPVCTLVGYDGPDDAVRLAASVADEADLVLVTGSFYVLSAAREALALLHDGSDDWGDEPDN